MSASGDPCEPAADRGSSRTLRFECSPGGSFELADGLVRVDVDSVRQEPQRTRDGARVTYGIVDLRVTVGPRHHSYTLGRSTDRFHHPLRFAVQIPLSLWLDHELELELVAVTDGGRKASFAARMVALEGPEVEGDAAALDPETDAFVAWWGVFAAASLDTSAPVQHLAPDADPTALVPDLRRVPDFACTLDPGSTGALEVDFWRGPAGWYVRVRGGCEVREERLIGPYTPA